MNGIDVSKWNGLINWANVKNSGVEFAILKATQKDNGREPALDTNYNGCKTCGIPVGLYRYVYAKNEAEARAEAEGVLRAIGDKEITCGVWLDLEDASIKTLGKTALNNIINAEAEVLQAAGYKVGLYMNKYWHDSVVDSKNLKNLFPFWIARYPANDNGTIKETLSPQEYAVAWQYSSKGKMNGISGFVDLNKSFTDLQFLMSGTHKETAVKTKTGEGLAAYALEKIGTPYFYGLKFQKLTEARAENLNKLYPSTVSAAYIEKARAKNMFNKICVDCSGLIGGYREKQIGSSQLYSTAAKRLTISELERFPVGCVLWKKGHVGVYIGGGYCVEAKGIDYGTIKSKVSATKWSYGLLFDDMSYEGESVAARTDKNPYKEPTELLKYGSTGEGVKWLQYELNEAGYSLSVDGIFKDKTKAALIAFQTSSKIEVDGICGKETRAALKI